MGIGTSIFLLAVGAILRYAVTVTTQGVNLHTVGDILMVIGVIGILLSLVFWGSWGGFGGARRRDPLYRRTVVERDSEVY
ncbi:MAG: hypothetical protein QOJ52_3482 [Acidimicrobiaceae bacterium]|jgi:hypothetical protein|nr:hypothetical protein [Acidimicrobiaceae bacterium]MDQ1364454.1 hypothetical protein [Acidimicrobiaceae bacterium]MDQ1378787.1 hypothetical protein [Acidimicrobiaceae bacterium]MDQ1414726.1 hypothetical protein [Acidimicrobiaceae bacterium]MDQ1421520.1 hypothetical protein [Acidimicrobiaceae bacterium]